MHRSKFMQNHSNRNHQRSFFPSFEFNSAELYPRRRRTEFYHQASIPDEYQNRNFEHPSNLDHEADSNRVEGHRKNKIIPPHNSEMRVFRDSYFS